MQLLFKNWKGTAELNGKSTDITKLDFNTLSGNFHIVLNPSVNTSVNRDVKSVIHKDLAATNTENTAENITYRIKVRKYMTQPASPEFDFMVKWNNNTPMPLRVMVGEKVKETRGMVYMVLHGDITERITQCCMKCGRPITNNVSKFFGMGPECGGHRYVNPFESEEELSRAVESYRRQLREITWEGWIVKSAIEEEVIING